MHLKKDFLFVSICMGLIFLISLFLKLCGITSLSWNYILIPICIPPVLFVISFFIFTLLTIFEMAMEMIKDSLKKKE
jgi:hypothetical protein